MLLLLVVKCTDYTYWSIYVLIQWSPDKSSVFGSSAEDGLLNIWDYDKVHYFEILTMFYLFIILLQDIRVQFNAGTQDNNMLYYEVLLPFSLEI